MTHLSCTACGLRHEWSRLQNLCTACHKPLFPVYDLAAAGRVLTRETLIDRVWGPHYVGDTKTLDVHIKRLRAKVEDDPSHPTRITTIRGLGYRYEKPR